MEDNAGHGNAAGDLRELRRSGNGRKRKIGSVDFRRAIGQQAERGTIGGGRQVHDGGVGSGRNEMIGRAGVPGSERSAGGRSEPEKNLVAHGIGLNERRSGQAGDFWLRSSLDGWWTHRKVHLSEASGACGGRAAFTAEANEDALGTRGGDAGGTRVGETGNTAYKHG
jgi:hypothetical protein